MTTSPKQTSDEIRSVAPGIEVCLGRVGGKPTLAGRRFTVAQFVAEMAGHALSVVCADFDLDRNVAELAMRSVCAALNDGRVTWETSNAQR